MTNATLFTIFIWYCTSTYFYYL